MQQAQLASFSMRVYLRGGGGVSRIRVAQRHLVPRLGLPRELKTRVGRNGIEIPWEGSESLTSACWFAVPSPRHVISHRGSKGGGGGWQSWPPALTDRLFHSQGLLKHDRRPLIIAPVPPFAVTFRL